MSEAHGGHGGGGGTGPEMDIPLEEQFKATIRGTMGAITIPLLRLLGLEEYDPDAAHH